MERLTLEAICTRCNDSEQSVNITTSSQGKQRIMEAIAHSGPCGRDFFLKIAMPKSELVGISPSRTPLVTLMWRDVMATLLPLGLGTVFRGDTDPNWSSLSSFLKRIWF